MTVLDDILAGKRDEVTMLRRRDVRDLLQRHAVDASPARGFADALRRDHLAVISEIKRRSPSKGDLAPNLDPAATAKAYASGGAAALSVLTDQVWFGGRIDDLEAARNACELPVLRKDFIIDEVQVFETRAIGADALLLICAAIPDDVLLADLHTLATELGLDVLVEAHDAGEIERALGAGAQIVGVNARDLGTFVEDRSLSERLAAQIPADRIAVAESAIRSADDAAAMAGAGFDAVLVGEALVRAEDPSAMVAAMTAPARTPR